MQNVAEDIFWDLKRRYKVDEYFYPKLSMNIDIPNGLVGEITEICGILEKSGFRVTSDNVFNVMNFKKMLLKKFDETIEGRKSREEYKRIILEEIEPTGITIPIDLLLVGGIVLLLVATGRFIDSFSSEAGKIAARKLLGDEKKRSKEHNLRIKEYEFLRNQAVVLIERGNDLNSFIQNLQKAEQKEK